MNSHVSLKVKTHEIEVSQRDDGFERLSFDPVVNAFDDILNAAPNVFVEEGHQVFLFVLRRPIVYPLLPEGQVSEILRIDVDHATSGDRGRGRVLKVKHLATRKVT